MQQISHIYVRMAMLMMFYDGREGAGVEMKCENCFVFEEFVEKFQLKFALRWHLSTSEGKRESWMEFCETFLIGFYIELWYRVNHLKEVIY